MNFTHVMADGTVCENLAAWGVSHALPEEAAAQLRLLLCDQRSTNTYFFVSRASSTSGTDSSSQ